MCSDISPLGEEIYEASIIRPSLDYARATFRLRAGAVKKAFTDSTADLTLLVKVFSTIIFSLANFLATSDFYLQA